MLRILSRANCKRIHFGVEAGTEKIIKILNKGITLEQVYKAFKNSKKYGISTLAYFMIGNPEETLEDIIEIKIIMLYSPQTIFLPIGIFGLVISVALTVYKLTLFSRFTPNIGIFYLASLFTILLSLIAEQIANMRFELIELSRARNNHNQPDGRQEIRPGGL